MAVPTIPSALVATAASTQQVDLTWSDDSSDEDNFELEKFDGFTWTAVAEPAADSEAYTVRGLTPGGQYKFRLRSVNGDGESAWLESNSVTLATVPIPNGRSQDALWY